MNSANDSIGVAASKLAAKASYDIIFISGGMDYDTQDKVSTILRVRRNKRKNLLLILCTPGGLPDVAYRVSRSLQECYEHISVLVAGWCKSAGTLCVIGANEVVMTDEAELGPLDIQISRRDEIGERDSGLVVDEAMRALKGHAFSMFEDYMLLIKQKSEGVVTFKMAAELATSLTNGLLAPIYSRIDPEKLGANTRSLEIASAYGNRLNIKSKNLKADVQTDALDLLTCGYPSHGFVIDRREAQGLFNRVRVPTVEESELVHKLGEIAVIPSVKLIAQFLDVQEKYDDQAKVASKGKKSDDGYTPAKGVVKPIKRSGSATGASKEAA